LYDESRKNSVASRNGYADKKIKKYDGSSKYAPAVLITVSASYIGDINKKIVIVVIEAMF
jgi:hypothetical protein